MLNQRHSVASQKTRIFHRNFGRKHFRSVGTAAREMKTDECYVCMYVCTYVCVYVCTYVCVYECITYLRVYVRTYVCMCVCACVGTCIWMYVCMHAFTYFRITPTEWIMIRESGNGNICCMLGIVPLDVLWVRKLGWTTQSCKQQNKAEKVLELLRECFVQSTKGNEARLITDHAYGMGGCGQCYSF
jgi:hypothetical protein